MRIREAKKQASRARVVEAAKALFEDVGFHETTVRMIAERSGLSPGGVFTTFEDKVEILSHILAEGRDALFEAIEALRPGLSGSARERLKAVLGLAHDHDFPRLKMVVAHSGASFGWSALSEQQEQRQLHRRLAGVVAEILREAKSSGELKAGTDVELLADAISALYICNYRTAHFGGLSRQDLETRVARQVDYLFDGVAA